LLFHATDEDETTMSRLIRYIVAGASLGTAFMALLHAWQFDRSMRRAFALSTDDLP
jgi:hypothetical protein